jgi:hypothetical protein
MKLHFVRVPTEDSGPIEEELNRFLGTHRIVSIDRHLVADGARSAWAICVTYVDADAGRDGAQSGGLGAGETPAAADPNPRRRPPLSPVAPS